MSTHADELQSLHRGLRDLVAFTALPGVWAGREPQYIVESLADVLVRTLGAELVYVSIQGAPGEAALEAARAAQQPEVASQAHALGAALAPWLRAARSSALPAIPNPVGGGRIQFA